MNAFEQKIFEVINKYSMLESGDRVVVGLSGGADSCTLLSALCSLKNVLKIEIVAAHLNHGIRGDEALRDMNFSRKFAQGYSRCGINLRA